MTSITYVVDTFLQKTFQETGVASLTSSAGRSRGRGSVLLLLLLLRRLTVLLLSLRRLAVLLLLLRGLTVLLLLGRLTVLLLLLRRLAVLLLLRSATRVPGRGSRRRRELSTLRTTLSIGAGRRRLAVSARAKTDASDEILLQNNRFFADPPGAP
jgi:hypothetical protein